jgi:exopolyphosphatase/guanosine-5'-triphosphate,3'-diphosphate pyrophosphatase
MHSDLAGWSAREIEVMANVVRYHRRAYPKRAHANFARLAKADRRLVRRLAGMLRVAAALNRSHQQLVTDVRCHARRERVTIVVQAVREPLVELWDARRKAGLFEKAFAARLTVRWDDATAAAARPLRVVRVKRGA